ncbi:MAG: cupin domain-containing protein [Chloroflexi bacterium]|nr:cupin domain-containing protein [Chloroflexota bacterium]
MQIVKINEKEAKESKDSIFKGGKVSVQQLIGQSEKDYRVFVINFSQGAVNKLHSHSFDQILYVTEGKGIVATKEKEVVVTPGTVIFIPAGESHWHGATKDSSFSHIAVMPPGTTSF